MLGIAFITLAVLLVLFGVCAYAFLKGGRAEEYEDEDVEDVYEEEAPREERPRKRRTEKKIQPEEADGNESADEEAAAEQPETEQPEQPAEEKAPEPEIKQPAEPKKTKEAEPAEARPEKLAQKAASSAASVKRETAKTEPVSEQPEIPEPAAEDKTAKKPEPVSETKPENKPETVSQVKDDNKADDISITRVVKKTEDVSKTRIVTKAEMEQIKAAAAEKLASDVAPVPERETPPYEDEGAEYEEEETEGRSINLVPVIAVSAAVLVVLGAVAFFIVRSDSNRRGTETVVEPETITATVDNIREETQFAGTIESESPEISYFAASGRVEEVRVSEGDRVESGQVLYVLDSSAVEERIALYRERLENATVTTESEVERTSEATASAGGTVSNIYVSVGDEVSEGDRLAEITSVSDYRVSLEFDLEETGEISGGDATTVTVGSSTFDGTVVSVRENTSEEEGEAVTATVTISFSGENVSGTRAGAEINGVQSMGVGSISEGSRTSNLVRAGADGTVSELNVSEGDSISAGDVAAVITYTETVSETTTDELEARDINIQIDQLENELQNYTVTAESDGYVKTLYVQEGENAAVNMQAAEIIPDGSLYLNVSISEEEAESLTIPASATYSIIRTSDIPEEAWEDVSTDTEYTAVMDSLEPDSERNGVYSGRISIENQDGLLEGMTAEVNVVTYSRFDALLIPQELVRDGKVSVWRANRAEEVEVETGIVTDDGYVEILSGINSVDRIIVEETVTEE